MTRYMWFFFGSMAGAAQLTVISGTSSLPWFSSVALSLVVYYFSLLGVAAIDLTIALREAAAKNER